MSGVYNRIKSLIEDTNDAFVGYDGAVNSDYAEFATMSLYDFKRLLRDPALTEDQLKAMLRSGMRKYRKAQQDSCWSTFMAIYVTRQANRNDTFCDVEDPWGAVQRDLFTKEKA